MNVSSVRIIVRLLPFLLLTQTASGQDSVYVSKYPFDNDPFKEIYLPDSLCASKIVVVNFLKKAIIYLDEKRVRAAAVEFQKNQYMQNDGKDVRKGS